MSLVVAEKHCPNCQTIKPLAEFHRNRRRPDGAAWECKDCGNRRAKATAERQRQEMGEEAFLAYRRHLTAQSRRRTGNARGRVYANARHLAASRLIEAHRSEFEHLLAIALREVEAESAAAAPASSDAPPASSDLEVGTGAGSSTSTNDNGRGSNPGRVERRAG